MNTLNEMLQVELKNLYALEKQMLEVLPKLEEIKGPKKFKKRINTIRKKSNDDFEALKKVLSKLDINPGNTIDSVGAEILANIDEIMAQDIDVSIKNAGILASLTRLTHYKTACYKVTRQLAKELGMKKLSESLKSSRKVQEKQASKLKKVAKKIIVKKD